MPCQCVLNVQRVVIPVVLGCQFVPLAPLAPSIPDRGVHSVFHVALVAPMLPMHIPAVGLPQAVQLAIASATLATRVMDSLASPVT